jgi:hypothetical protein
VLPVLKVFRVSQELLSHRVTQELRVSKDLLVL